MRSAPMDPDRPDGLCGASTVQGETCKNIAGWGTSHAGVGTCKWHGGAMASHVARAEAIKAEIVVADVRARWDIPDEITCEDFLAEELRRTTAAVRWLDHKVSELSDEEMVFGVVQRRSDGIRSEVVSAAGVHTWTKLWQAERAHGMRVAKSIAELGIEERRVALEEAEVSIVAAAVRRAIEDAPGDPERAMQIAAERLRSLDG